MSTITLYTNPMSRGRIIRWMLEECGAYYDAVLLEYGTTMKTDEYLAINPMGKVPALVDGDAVITEVAAIILWLADRFPEKNLVPALNTPERAAYYRWITFVFGPLEAVMNDKMIGHFGKPMNVGYGSPDDTLDTLEALIGERDFIIGDHFTAADLLLAAYLGFYMKFKLIEPRPAFVRYSESHNARPAARHANEIDEKLLAEAQNAG